MPSRRKVKVFCLYCGKELKLKPCGKYNYKFCNRECYKKHSIGKNHKCFKGGRFIDNKGYVKILIEGKAKYQPEHRYLIEKVLGRKLCKDEVVHHIDENKLNNRLDNLLLIKNGEHARLHLLGKPQYKSRKYKVLLNLPEPINENEIVSLLPEYRTYKTTKCVMCGKLFWHRKDYPTRNCSSSCGLRGAWNERNENRLGSRRKSSRINNKLHTL